MTLEQFTTAKKAGQTELLQELEERLRSFSQELAKVDEVLKSNRFKES
jgi:hypothetical protein